MGDIYGDWRIRYCFYEPYFSFGGISILTDEPSSYEMGRRLVYGSDHDATLSSHYCGSCCFMIRWLWP